MPDHLLHLAKPSLAYAKLVATPTDTAWSQVYNAGNLFACLSLSLEEPEAEVSLQLVGKEVFNNLEAEFFTLEKKTLESIKSALETSIQALPSAVKLNLTLAYFKDQILYVYIAGSGRIIMKRGGKTGVLLDKKHGESTDVSSASGYLENDDTIILETRQFADDMPQETIVSALELALPNDIAEALSPQIHEKDDGGQAAIVIVYHGVTKSYTDEETIEDIVDEEEEKREKLLEDRYAKDQESVAEEFEDDEEEEEIVRKKRSFKLPSLPSFAFLSPVFSKLHIKSIRLPHRKRLFLSIALILVALLFLSIFTSKQKEEQARTKTLFESIYTPALKNYDEGLALKTLNESLSREDLLKAQQLLKNGSAQFKDDSTEKKKIDELLQKVEAELGPITVSQDNNAKEVKTEAGSLLAIEKANSEGKGFTQDADNVYFVTSKAVFGVAKSGAKKTELIKNDGSFANPKGIAVYQGNLYILDVKNAVLKFVETSDGYSESNYFQGSTPDLKNAQAIAIDGSVWILFSDGTISKYTRGARDEFKVTGLDKGLSSPTKIITSLDMESVYVLDRGNNRIVKFAKTGKFESQVASGVIGQATDFDVLEADKIVHVLSGGKVFELSL